MATKNHNLSQFDSPLPSAAEMRFGIVVAEWNREVTEALLEGAVRTLRAAGCPDLNIQIKYVPGTFELALGAQFFNVLIDGHRHRRLLTFVKDDGTGHGGAQGSGIASATGGAGERRNRFSGGALRAVPENWRGRDVLEAARASWQN